MTIVITEEERWAVRGGASLLDDAVPGWADRIDVFRLDMCSSVRCIFGQLYGDYDEGVRLLTAAGYDPIALGFTLAPSHEPVRVRWPQWTALTEMWAQEVLARA